PPPGHAQVADGHLLDHAAAICDTLGWASFAVPRYAWAAHGQLFVVWEGVHGPELLRAKVESHEPVRFSRISAVRRPFGAGALPQYWCVSPDGRFIAWLGGTRRRPLWEAADLSGGRRTTWSVPRGWLGEGMTELLPRWLTLWPELGMRTEPGAGYCYWFPRRRAWLAFRPQGGDLVEVKYFRLRPKGEFTVTLPGAWVAGVTASGAVLVWDRTLGLTAYVGWPHPRVAMRLPRQEYAALRMVFSSSLSPDGRYFAWVTGDSGPTTCAAQDTGSVEAPFTAGLSVTETHHPRSRELLGSVPDVHLVTIFNPTDVAPPSDIAWTNVSESPVSFIYKDVLWV
ncbi:MAG: hypothetical protein ACREQ5_39905, partial [Candidatus Dormibacteria bacterium]